MPEIVIKPRVFEETIIKSKPTEIFEKISVSKTISEKINTSYVDAVKTENVINKTILDADVAKITKANIDIVIETSIKLDIKVDIADTKPVENLQTKIIENFGKPIEQVVDTLKTSEGAMKPESVTAMRDILNTTGESIHTNMERVVEVTEPNSLPEYKIAMDELKVASQALDKAINSNDINAIKNAKANFDRAQANIETKLDKLENLRTKIEASGQDWKTFKEILKFSLYLSIMVGTLVGVFFILPKALTGCYLFKNVNGSVYKYKLGGCSDWYNQDANQNYCSCGTLTDEQKQVDITKPDCNSLPNDKNNPYCLGLTSGDTNPRCQFPSTKRYQCNKIGDFTKDGAIWYSFQLYTPMSIIADTINTAENVFNSLPSGQDIIKYLIIAGAIFGVISLIVIFIMIFKN